VPADRRRRSALHVPVHRAGRDGDQQTSAQRCGEPLDELQWQRHLEHQRLDGGVMMLTRRALLIGLTSLGPVVVGVACALAAPGVPPTGSTAVLKGGAAGPATVVLANATEARNLNPMFAQEGASQIIWELMFEGLIRADATTGAPSPWLADRWEASS